MTLLPCLVSTGEGGVRDGLTEHRLSEALLRQSQWLLDESQRIALVESFDRHIASGKHR